MHAFLLHSEGFDWQIAVADSTVFNFLMAGSCWIVALIMQFYLPRQERFWYIILLSAALSAGVVFLGRAVLNYTMETEKPYLQVVQQWLPIRFGIAFLMIACMAMISLLWYSFQDQKETEDRKATAVSLKKEAELIALRRQLQPHFLFNSLNSISALVGTKPVEARRMIQQLSDFLRGTIKKENDELVTLEEELAHLQLYLEIEKVRFGHRLNTIISSADEYGKIKMPALILQPVVENAIKFGLYGTTDDVTITINAQMQNNELLLTVTNPFDAETAAVHAGTGFGLESVKRRLYLLFARQDLVITTTDNNIFTTTIKIPQQK